MMGLLKKESGFALILTLVLTVLMVAVVVEMIHQVYVDTSISRGFRDGQQASLLAESGVTGGAKLLQMALSGRSYTSLSDSWATPLRLEDDTGLLEISVSEESGKLNINGLVQQNGEYEPFTLAALQSLGVRLKLPIEVWGATADWMDSDDAPRSGGAETAYYSTLKPGYSTRNAKLMTVTELSLIKGIKPDILNKLRPYLTIFSAEPLPKININTAPKDVLTALDQGINDRIAERILEERRLQPFKSEGEFSRVPELNTLAMGRGIGRLAVMGKIFRITSVAKVHDSGRTVEAVVRISGQSLEFLSWQEY